MTDPIIFTITEAGKQAALQAINDNTKILIDLAHVAVGKSKYTPTGNETSLKNEAVRTDIVSGEVVGNTLRFSSTIYANEVTPVYEMGILTRTGVLFAVAASTTDPLVTVYPDIAFVASFGISIDDINAGNITVSIDSNSGLATTLMQNHVAAANPHPQYVALSRFQLLLDAMFPVGYLHHTNSTTNPKTKFDQLLGINTFWRRLAGRIIVSTDPNDDYIKDVGVTLGQKGMTDLAGSSERPNAYPLYTKHIFERYNPDDVIETVWSISANKSSITEGGAVRFTVTANNVPDGQILSWTVKEGGLNIGSNDITTPDKTDSGTVILRNASATIDFTTTPDDNEVESQKHVRLTIGAPANLSINVPISDLGNTETVLHISQSTTNGIDLAEYYKTQSGSYPSSTDKIRFIVDAGVDVIAPDTNTPAMIEGSNWTSGAEIIVENRGRILGRGGDGGRSAHIIGLYRGGDSDIDAADIRPAKNGGNGGMAIKAISNSILIENYSIIAGGGGGGGGQGAWAGISPSITGGGGGSGGGAPFGRRSPNQGTLQAYNVDPTAIQPRLSLPADNRVYYSMNLRDDGSTLQGVGIVNEGVEYTVPLNETRSVFVPLSSDQSSNYLEDDFDGVYCIRFAGISSLSVPLKMSKNASINTGGIGGYGATEGQYDDYAAASKNNNVSVNHGGSGGDFGENGGNGVIAKIYSDPNGATTTKEDVNIYSENATGGLAGFVKEGSVTITNFSAGTTKGR